MELASSLLLKNQTSQKKDFTTKKEKGGPSCSFQPRFSQLLEIPTIIRGISKDDAKIQALAENWHRADLTSQEREDAIYGLYQQYKSERAVADKLGLAPSTVHAYVEAKQFRLKALGIPSVQKASFTALTETSFLKDDKARIAILQMIAEGKRSCYSLSKYSPKTIAIRSRRFMPVAFSSSSSF